MQDEYFYEDELEYYNKQLTEACCAIFGDIVVKATFSGNHYRKGKEYHENYLEHQITKP